MVWTLPIHRKHLLRKYVDFVPVSRYTCGVADEQEYIAHKGRYYQIEWYYTEDNKSQALEYHKKLSAADRRKVLRLFQMMVNIAAVPLSARWDLIGNGRFVNSIRSIVVSCQSQMQIIVIAIQQFFEIACASVDVGTWMIQGRQAINSKMFGGFRPLDLHQAVAVAI